MTNRKIIFIGELMYATPEEISKSKNLKDILPRDLKMEKIPIRLLELGGGRCPGYICVIGEGALYPWKKGQSVSVSFIKAFICELWYRRELRINGHDVPEDLGFSVYDTIIPLQPGRYSADKDDKSFSGFVTVELYEDIAKLYGK